MGTGFIFSLCAGILIGLKIYCLLAIRKKRCNRRCLRVDELSDCDRRYILDSLQADSRDVLERCRELINAYKSNE